MAIAPYSDTPRPASTRRLGLSERVDHLSRLDLFASCSKAQLRALARLMRVEIREAGAELITEGDVSTEAFIIVAGSALVKRKGRKVAELGVGQVVGELGLLADRPRNASVTALTPMELLAISRSDLRASVEQSPQLAWMLLQTVAARLTE